jgi:hypothetical protein
MAMTSAFVLSCSLIGSTILGMSTNLDAFVIWNSVVAFLILVYFFFSAYRFIGFLRLEDNRPNVIGVVLAVGLISIALLIDWPGLISGDDFFMLKELAHHQLSSWHSLTYSSLSQSMKYIFAGGIGIPAFNFLIFLNLTTCVFSLATWKWTDFSFWGILFLLLTPQVQMFVIFLNRDSTYTLILLLFALGLLQRGLGRTQAFRIRNWELIFFGLILGEMRQEGVFIILLTPFLVYYFTSETQFKNKKVLYKGLTAVTFGAVFLFFLLPRFFSTDLIPNDYKATALVNPLSYIIHEKGIDSLSPEQREDIDQYFKIDYLVAYYNPIEIDPFHRGGIRGNTDPDSFSKFRQATFQLIFDNFGLFLKNRFNMFKQLFISNAGPYTYANDLRALSWSERSQIQLQGVDVLWGPFALQAVAQDKLQRARGVMRTLMPIYLYQFLFASIIPLFALLYLLIWGGSKQFAILSGLFVLRALIFSALTPAAQFKYISSIWLGGWLLIFIYFKVKTPSSKLNSLRHFIIKRKAESKVCRGARSQL